MDKLSFKNIPACKYLLIMLIISCSTSCLNQIELNISRLGRDTVKPAPASNNNQEMINGLIFFQQQDLVNGAELWQTDGSVAGTKIFKDIFAGTSSSIPHSFFSFNSKKYFVANDALGYELWMTDGTTDGTSMVKDIVPGAASSEISSFFISGNKFYFASNEPTIGTQLWVSDGTTNGTELIKTISPGTYGSVLFRLDFNGKVIFTANDNIHGFEVWITDGTTAGTNIVKDITPMFLNPTDFSNFKKFGTKFVFQAETPGEGLELWISDGTDLGTFLLKDINPGVSNTYISKLVVTEDYVYFLALDTSTFYNLYRTDGTSVGTVLLHSQMAGSSGSALAEINGKIVFMANDGVTGYEPWVFDTIAGASLLKDLTPGITGQDSLIELISKNNKLYFITPTSTGTRIIETDGTSLGTLVNQEISTNADEYISNRFSKDGNIYFSAGSDFWISDFTQLGTKKIVPAASFPDAVILEYRREVVGNRVFFMTDNYLNNTNSFWVVNTDTMELLKLATDPGNIVVN